MTRMLSFRAADELTAALTAEARFAGVKLSVFLREAAAEKVERQRAARLRELSRLVSAESLAANTDIDDTLADGLSG